MANLFRAQNMPDAKSSRAIVSTSCILQLEVSMNCIKTEDTLTLYGQSFASRLLLGTSRYESPVQLAAAIRAADPGLLTVSVRRQLTGGRLGSQNGGGSFWNLLCETGRKILPNTAGCHTAREAVNTASMARELFQTNFIKLEVIGDEVDLQPGPSGLHVAAP